MFINCKHCGSLVATDPATDLPPERCPRCRGVLRSAAAAPQVSVASLLRTPQPAAVVDAPVSGQTEAPPTDPKPPVAPSIEAPAAQVEVAAAGIARSEVTTADPTADIPSDHHAGARAPDTDTDTDTAASPTVATAAAPPPAAPTPAPAATRSSPSFARRGSAAAPPDPRARRQHRVLMAAVTALALLLGLQILLADRGRLAADAAWRPTLMRVCGVLRCSLPAWREPSALTVLARDVRPDPEHPAQLLATATFRNDARWAQAWPRMRLTLSDIDGATVGTRVFSADDYLRAAPETGTLPAGHSVETRLQLREPDARAVSFAFDFL